MSVESVTIGDDVVSFETVELDIVEEVIVCGIVGCLDVEVLLENDVSAEDETDGDWVEVNREELKGEEIKVSLKLVTFEDDRGMLVDNGVNETEENVASVEGIDGSTEEDILSDAIEVKELPFEDMSDDANDNLLEAYVLIVESAVDDEIISSEVVPNVVETLDNVDDNGFDVGTFVEDKMDVNIDVDETMCDDEKELIVSVVNTGVIDGTDV